MFLLGRCIRLSGGLSIAREIFEEPRYRTLFCPGEFTTMFGQGSASIGTGAGCCYSDSPRMVFTQDGTDYNDAACNSVSFSM